MDIFIVLLDWLPGALLLMNAIPMSFVVGINAAIPLFIMSALFLPPVGQLIESKTNITIHPKTKTVILFLLYVPHFYFILSHAG
jgi:hypothetical protein